MRDPGTEPLVMIGSDVVELTKMLYAEREAHAAEVAWLRGALERIYGYACHAAKDSRSRDEDRRCIACVLEDSRTALAAPPTAAVEAVEGLRKALEAQVCGLCCNRIGWSGDLTQAQRFLGRGDWRTCVRCRDARAALAAYEEALRG